MYKQDYVGIYWTRPVPWAHFNVLSSDPAVAATESKTIWYQREVISRYVRDYGGNLAKEIALIDIEKDRSSPEPYSELASHIKYNPRRFIYVYVNFSSAYGWRSNHFLSHTLADMNAKQIALDPDPINVPGAEFNPIEHFREWRERDSAFRERKKDLPEIVRELLKEHGDKSWAVQACMLNEAGVKTLTGREWSADSLRKFWRPK